MFRSSVNYAILDVVAKHKDLTVQALHQQICTQGISVSLPNFYKIIAHMVDDQILIRPKGKLQIHSIFHRYLAGLAEGAQRELHNSESNPLLKLAEGQQETRNEMNLYDLNVIRTDLLGKLVKMYPCSASYHYRSHPYYLLSTPEKEQATMEELASGLDSSQMLIGNTTYLDRYGSQLLNRDLIITTCTDHPPFPEEGYTIDVIGDYIVECTFPPAISEHFTLFFQTIIGIEGYKKELFCQILKMKTPCTLKLIHSAKHAKTMGAKIEKAFTS